MEVDSPRKEYYVKQPDRLVRELTYEKAMEVVRKAEEDGLVHFGQCWCCVHDCEFLYPMARANRYDLISPNRFQATMVDRELCIGCQDCVERCPFNAIEMRKDPNSKKLKESIISENCKGCGACITGCKQRALKYEIVRPPEYLPSLSGRPSGPPRGPLTWGYYNLK
jgi:Pyruvate/2-oxoacid:ferredoxin oxidoreductase delta subunit